MQKEFRLLKIELNNVFNYRGKHVIDFNTDSTGNVFLFDIKNGGGKTSLFLSIKWGFYGFEDTVRYEKDGLKLTGVDFMNQDSVSEMSFSVKISFLYDGSMMELRRECPDYHSNKTDLTLKVDGIMERDDAARNHVSQIIPPDYGDFFMFNGEILNDMAINQKDKVKMDGVLKLLGLKQLSDLRDTISKIKNEQEEDFYKNVALIGNSGDLQVQINQKNQELGKVKEDLKDVEVELSNLNKEISELEESRRLLSDVEGILTKISQCGARIKELEGDIDGTIEVIKKNSPNAFLLFLHDDISDLLERLNSEKKELKKSLDSPTGKRNEYTYLQESILSEHILECPVCRSILSDDQLNVIRSILDESQSETTEHKELRNRFNEITGKITLLKDCFDSEPVNLNNQCTRVFDYLEDMRNTGNRLDELNRLASESEVDSIKQISSDLVALYKIKANLEAKYNKLIRLKNSGEQKLAKLRSDFSTQAKLDSQQRIKSNRIDYAKDLLSNIDHVIKKLKRQKRQDILDRANEVFMCITNKPDVYSGLAYDDSDSFSMHILRKDGVKVLHPSSGEKHVLAISFLISLSLNTERLNPMMMDTPLSRLDVEHKKNIGTMLSHLDNQVLFLAQPGELDSETRQSFTGTIAKMYESRPTDDNTASIVEVSL